MRNLKSLYGMAMMMAMLDGGMGYDIPKPIRRQAPKPTPKKDIIPNGLKKFTIDGVEVWALNEKNARRKAGKTTK